MEVKNTCDDEYSELEEYHPLSEEEYKNKEPINILEIILSCVKSEAYLCNAKKEILITDISEKNIISILKAVDYNFKALLELHDYLLELMEDKKWKEEQDFADEERDRFLDEQWLEENGDDACDNCGFSGGRNHDCDNSIYGDCNEEVPVTINNFFIKIIERLDLIKNKS